MNTLRVSAVDSNLTPAADNNGYIYGLLPLSHFSIVRPSSGPPGAELASPSLWTPTSPTSLPTATITPSTDISQPPAYNDAFISGVAPPSSFSTFPVSPPALDGSSESDSASPPTHTSPDPAFLVLTFSSIPSEATSDAQPRSAKRKSAPRDPNQPPRPSNAFLIFRRQFCANRSAGAERDSRVISRIVGRIWKQMSDEQKRPYFEEGAREKTRHAETYPGYRFRLTAPRSARGSGGSGKKRRNYKRSGQGDLERCDRMAELYLEGKEGKEMEEAMAVFDREEAARAASQLASASTSPQAIAQAAYSKPFNAAPAFEHSTEWAEQYTLPLDPAITHITETSTEAALSQYIDTAASLYDYSVPQADPPFMDALPYIPNPHLSLGQPDLRLESLVGPGFFNFDWMNNLVPSSVSTSSMSSPSSDWFATPFSTAQ